MLKIYLNSFSQLIHGKFLNRLVTSEPNFLAPPASGSLILKIFRNPERKWQLLKKSNSHPTLVYTFSHLFQVFSQRNKLKNHSWKLSVSVGKTSPELVSYIFPFLNLWFYRETIVILKHSNWGCWIPFLTMLFTYFIRRCLISVTSTE
jgi:hypothetical protein